MANEQNGELRRLALCFEGEVQGVGFRWTSQRLANTLGLTGWVRNEWDGTVRMELQGTSEQISEFFGALGRAWGNFAPHYVIAEREDMAPKEDDEPSFRVKF